MAEPMDTGKVSPVTDPPLPSIHKPPTSRPMTSGDTPSSSPRARKHVVSNAFDRSSSRASTMSKRSTRSGRSSRSTATKSVKADLFSQMALEGDALVQQIKLNERETAALKKQVGELQAKIKMKRRHIGPSGAETHRVTLGLLCSSIIHSTAHHGVGCPAYRGWSGKCT